ncbi:three-prime repair exonuclease 1 isoform X2 [Tiliqua scincoides]|uniref:three-prime repair exonuclease 1 isoform X2 n=1 Tax=Tiliqua scincoides TaxID=71010 RepID=UPI0034623070
MESVLVGARTGKPIHILPKSNSWIPSLLTMYSASELPPRPIQTFVFMDLEATGLPPSRPKIAEMCLVSVSRHALENPQYTNYFTKPIPSIPRLADKLCVCINPDKPFTPTASSITGLNNEMFASNKKQTFNLHILHMITAFFGRQDPPICLVAHNGYSYDFPLLRAELSALGISALDGIYCADTIKAMKALDNENNQRHQFLYQPSRHGGNKRYSLRDLYFKFYQVYPRNCHSAEGDVITLISIFQQRARDLIYWMDSNARPFNTIKAMYKENERNYSFSKMSGNIQRAHPSYLQVEPRQRVTRNCPNRPFPDWVSEPECNEYSPSYNSIVEHPAEFQNMLLVFLVLMLVTWIAFRTPE